MHLFAIICSMWVRVSSQSRSIQESVLDETYSRTYIHLVPRLHSLGAVERIKNLAERISSSVEAHSTFAKNFEGMVRVDIVSPIRLAWVVRIGIDDIDLGIWSEHHFLLSDPHVLCVD